ncbi:glycoside hydrolase family 16 protein [Paraglaciecola sp.]|uniref:glycoside hydrolase family 16 protein n=1 Tax=Paraglaciecola sp. TaxID=1920173 RepID=UPI00273E2493|nr:glycoside hydrolase family 16 protein [Paraglaciecola sp.]MDP5032315.1 family 16 glycosylhydrolase [Paraglaciecola sp.]
MNTISTQIQRLTVVAAAVSLFSCGGGSESNTQFDVVNPTEPVSDWVLVWGDEFDGATIDAKKWTHEVNCNGGGNNEQQCYTDAADNSFVSDGTLKIVAKPAEEGAALPYTSARLNTRYKADFKYGRFEMRAKLPEGQGSWPAFWMLPTDYVYGGWPKSGEIDIIEAVNLKTVDADGNVEGYVHGTLHYGQEWPANKSSGKAYALPDMANPADDFHTYALEWQEGEIRWYVDGYLYATQMASEIKYNGKGEAVGLNHRGWFAEYFDISTGELETHWDAAPFDQEFHLLLNLAVGGDWPSNVNNTGIDETAFANGQTFEIDYVHVYECSVNPDTGKGCETIRKGYKVEASEANPDGALVIGEAPIPVPPSTSGPAPLTMLYDDALGAGLSFDSYNPDSAISYSQVEEAGRGNVLEVVKTGATGNVYFTAAIPFDLTGYSPNAELVFDVNVASFEAGAELLVKLDSGWPNVSDYTVVLPALGEWAEVRINIAELLASGNRFAPGSFAKPESVTNIFVVEPTGPMSVKFDNIRLENPVGTEIITLYSDAPASDLVFDSYNPDSFVTYAQIEEDGRGNVLELVKTGATGNVYLTASPAYDLSNWSDAAEIVFDMYLTSVDSGVELLVKFDSGWPAVSDYSVALPAPGEWVEVRINIAELLANGNRFAPGNAADSANIPNIFVLEPTGALSAKFDNIRLENPPEPTVTSLYDDALSTDLVFDSYNPDSAISYSEVAEDERGSVLEVVKTGAVGNVYFNASVPFDVSSWGASSALVFDVNVASLDSGVELLIKFDSGWPKVSDTSVAIPTLGEWTTVRINIAELLANGNRFAPGNFADETSIANIFVIEPTGPMSVKFDNVRLEESQ